MHSALTLFVLLALIFILVRVSGDPTALLVAPDATTETREQIRSHFGLDKPLYVQFGYYLWNLSQGDLGNSFKTNLPVADILPERIVNSIKLSAVSLFLSILVAVPLGVLAATQRGRLPDFAAQLLAGLGQATPQFWLALILIQIFSVRLGWTPVQGIGDWKSYILPAISQSTFLVAAVIRLLRSSMLDVLDSEYVKMARIKGLPESRVIWIHAFRNGLLPVFTFAGIYVALIITSSVVTETVFNWPGLGRLAYDAIQWRDFNVIQAVVLIIAVIVVTINFIVDVLYAYLDPRVRRS